MTMISTPTEPLRGVFAQVALALALPWVLCLAAAAAEGPKPAASAASAPMPARAASSPQTAAELLQAIQDEIGAPDCDASTQCRSIAVGAKPCGGPEAYLIWSSKTGRPERLAALVGAHREARQAENARSGRMSDCRVLVDPGAVCRPRAADGKRVCQPGQGGTATLD
jgi:hypothetical protein